MEGRIQRALNSHWTVTILATMIGVFSGIYLNGVIDRKNTEQDKQKVVQNIIEEKENNEQALREAIKDQTKFFETFQFIEKYRDDEDNFIIEPALMSKFLQKYPDVFTFTDSIKVGTKINYKGEANVNFGMLQINLSNLAWETLQGSPLVNEFDFECMMNLNNLDKIEKEVIHKNSTILDLFNNDQGKDASADHFLKQLKFLLEIERTLLKFYENSEELIECF